MGPPGEAMVSVRVCMSLRSSLLSLEASRVPEYPDIVVCPERAGRRIGTADAEIAATCRSHGAVLATRNIDDFAHTGNPWI